MARADLHVHTRYSDHPSEWFLQRLGAAESYTEPEEVYRIAKAYGMDFVAITDHNRIDGALELKAAHPEDVIVGVETTAYFPDDGCKVHILLWGIDERQFERIQALRTDIYSLSGYIATEGIAHAVAHATYSVNGRLTVDHLEKLLLLFGSFETINGSRTRRQNERWASVLEGLSPRLISDIEAAHRRRPTMPQPWIKGVTGGSDDHAGLLIGRTWTEAEAETVEEFLDALRTGRTQADGRHNDYRALAFSIYRIALEFSQSRSQGTDSLFARQVNGHLFGIGGSPTAPAARLIAGLKASKDPLGVRLLELHDALEGAGNADLDARFDIAYEHLARASGEMLGSVLASTQDSLQRGDLTSMMRDISTALSAGFLAAPFFTTVGALSRGRSAADGLAARHDLGSREPRRILWFTDTLTDLNGVSVTLSQVARIAAERGDALRVVSCGLGDAAHLPETIIDLPQVFEFPLPYYESYTLSVPSPLESLKILQEFNADEVIVSTPGPVGAFGVALGRLLDVPCRFVYHNDFAQQAAASSGDESLAETVDAAMMWFCRQFDEILVPSQAYCTRLEAAGIEPSKLKPFRRGIDTAQFSPRRSGHDWLQRRFGLPEGPTLLYTGRISPEKSLETLVGAYRAIITHRPETNLLIIGDGPSAGRLRDLTADLERVRIPGPIPNEDLPMVYSACDLLVFPSKLDTFGMTVLEAQACGTPAVVSDSGGPCEIVVNGVTGYVVRDDCESGWSAAIELIFDLIETSPARYLAMCSSARHRALTYDWNVLLDALMAGSPLTDGTRARVTVQNGG
ncbi:MAG: glycosyltransferase [Coriobacteriia bacterium]|nr:glycosyltransferase [Coriobacteriia bacterium]MBN2839385.1 glycosyltransferase [Coriobacteriia bacterium]